MAFQSGEKLEKLVLQKLSQISKIIKNKEYRVSNKAVNVTIPQYVYKDIFTDRARVDFLHVNDKGKKFFIECKNQKVPGSVDTKFPYYIFNMQEQVYKDTTFIFVLNETGMRKKVLEWLINQSLIYKFYIVSSENLDELDKILQKKSIGYVFI